MTAFSSLFRVIVCTTSLSLLVSNPCTAESPSSFTINGNELTITTCTMSSAEEYASPVTPGPIIYLYHEFEESDCDNGLPPDSTNNDDITCLVGLTSIDPICENSGFYESGSTNNQPTPGLYVDGPAAYFRCEESKYNSLVDKNNLFWKIQYICGDTNTFFNGNIINNNDNLSKLQITGCVSIDRSGALNIPENDDDPWRFPIASSKCNNGLPEISDETDCAFGFWRFFMGAPITEHAWRVLPPNYVDSETGETIDFPTVEWYTDEDISELTYAFVGSGVNAVCGDLDEFGFTKYYCKIDETNVDYSVIELNDGNSYFYQKFNDNDCITSDGNSVNKVVKGDCVSFLRSIRHCGTDFYGMRILYPNKDERNYGSKNDGTPDGPGLLWRVDGGDCGDDLLLEVEYLCT